MFRAIPSLLVVSLALLSSGCDIDPVLSIPPFGTLIVNTVTSGTDLDPDGYRLLAQGPSLDVDRAIETNGTAIFSIATGGDYAAELSDIAANCLVDVNPQVVAVAVGSTSTINFNLSCS